MEDLSAQPDSVATPGMPERQVTVTLPITLPISEGTKQSRHCQAWGRNFPRPCLRTETCHLTGWAVCPVTGSQIYKEAFSSNTSRTVQPVVST